MSVCIHKLFVMQAASMLAAQFEQFGGNVLTQRIAPFLNDLINTVTIIVFLPIFNHMILPLFPRLSMSIKLRLVIGLVLNFVAILIAVFLQATVEVNSNDENNKFLWLLLPAVVLSVAESITFISCKLLVYDACVL